MAKFNSRELNVLKSSCGYIDTFIDGKTSISIENILQSEHRDMLAEVDGNRDRVLKYTMLSVLYNSRRKVPFFSAYNIDGTLKKESVPRIEFKDDPRVRISEQLDKKFYDLIYNAAETEFEIGHMASHNEMSWGINRTVQAQQTFHFTNSVPQVEKLNSGLWSKLESYVIAETNEVQNKRICVLTGPMLAEADPSYVKEITFQIPIFFFKVIVFSSKGRIYSTAFVMSQLKRLQELELIDTGFESFNKGITAPKPFSDYKHKDVFQVNIEMIENYTGYNFQWDDVTRINIPDDEMKLHKIAQTGGKNSLKGLESLIKDTGTPVLSNMILPNRE